MKIFTKIYSNNTDNIEKSNCRMIEVSSIFLILKIDLFEQKYSFNEFIEFVCYFRKALYTCSLNVYLHVVSFVTYVHPDIEYVKCSWKRFEYDK